jgi:hypothetical protein
VCGGKGGIPCAADEYCDYPDKLCGNADGTGTCMPRPMGCLQYEQPTCGCDGMVYDNPCYANAAGVDVANDSRCKAPPGEFGCGAYFCQQAGYYCEMDGSDVANTPSAFSCKPLPAACGTPPSCACLAGAMCGNLCAPTGDGGFRVTCPGG